MLAGERELMTAFPQIARCARHQLGPDGRMLFASLDRQAGLASLDRPNLMIRTGVGCAAGCPTDCEEHRGLHLPVLSFREG